MTIHDVAVFGIGVLLGIAVGIAGTARWVWWRFDYIEARYFRHCRDCVDAKGVEL